MGAPEAHEVCHEIVMVARSERIISMQNGSHRPICNALKRGVESKTSITLQNPIVFS